MNREQLAHVLRAAAQIVDDPDILVIGSQAILGTFDDGRLPDEATLSIEVDVAFWNDPDEGKADEIDGAIGELSSFHEQYGSFAAALINEQLVHVDTLLERAGTIDRPEGVRERVRGHIRRCVSGGSTGP